MEQQNSLYTQPTVSTIETSEDLFTTTTNWCEWTNQSPKSVSQIAIETVCCWSKKREERVSYLWFWRRRRVAEPKCWRNRTTLKPIEACPPLSATIPTPSFSPSRSSHSLSTVSSVHFTFLKRCRLKQSQTQKLAAIYICGVITQTIILITDQICAYINEDLNSL